MKPLVSILIPAFNAERWIAGTIKCAIGQTWENKEIIIVDDGSTDQTLAIAQEFASKTVTVVTQKNEGAAASRNEAFSLSRGDYVQWLDADDLMAPDKIEKQMGALDRCRSNRTLLSCAWGHFIYRLDKATIVPDSLWCDLTPIEWLLLKFKHNHFMLTSAWLVSRELTNAAGPWDTRLSLDDDGEYFCRVIRESDGICFVPEARTFYRRGMGSLSYVCGSTRKLESQFLSLRLQIAHLRSLEDSERVRNACLKYLQTYLLYFYPEKPNLVQQMHQLAANLGGRLETPRLSWKYAWIQKAVGWAAAKRTQRSYNRLKASLLRSWDGTLFRLKI